MNADDLFLLRFSVLGCLTGAGADPEDELFFLFTDEARMAGRPEKPDPRMADLLVNCLAVALGSPADSTHLYTCIFTPRRLDRRSYAQRPRTDNVNVPHRLLQRFPRTGIDVSAVR
jgi:hypothetical protein